MVHPGKAESKRLGIPRVLAGMEFLYENRGRTNKIRVTIKQELNARTWVLCLGLSEQKVWARRRSGNQYSVQVRERHAPSSVTGCVQNTKRSTFVFELMNCLFFFFSATLGCTNEERDGKPTGEETGQTKGRLHIMKKKVCC